MANGYLKGTVSDILTSLPIYSCNGGLGPEVKVTDTVSPYMSYQMNCVDGKYAFYLPEHTYNMTVTCSGHNTKIRNGIVVIANRTKTVNIYM
jgi:hypothetical protein